MGFKLKHAASVNRNIHLMSRLSLWTVNFRRLATKCLTLIRNDPRAESAASQTARNLQMQSRHAWTHCSLCLPRGLSWLLFIIHFFRVRCLNSNLERLLPGSITNVAHFSLPQIPGFLCWGILCWGTKCKILSIPLQYRLSNWRRKVS